MRVAARNLRNRDCSAVLVLHIAKICDGHMFRTFVLTPNKLYFSFNLYFLDAKERMRVAAKDQLVIEIAALYCSKLTKQKLSNATINKNEEVS